MHAVSPGPQTIDPSEHLVQFYEADPVAWAKSVGRYLAEGLKRGESVLVIASPDHKRAIVKQLNALGCCDPSFPEHHGRLAFLDAATTLARFLVNGEPDWDQFQNVVGGELQRLRSIALNGNFRAYGEMVGLLWSARQFAAAIRLEEYWNRLLQTTRFKLFCGYPINIFSDDCSGSDVNAVVCAHTHMVSTSESSDLRDALTRALDELAGTDTIDLQDLIHPARHPHTQIPFAEAAILSLHGSAEAPARDILGTARRYYQSEKRFQALIENSSDAIALLDASANITYSSASTERVLGFHPLELVGRNAFEFIHPDDAQTVQETLEEARTNFRDPVQVHARMLAKDRQWRWVEGTFTNLMHDPDVRAIVANYRDISRQKAAEENQKRVTEELARYNAELESFAYAATHDLREPLRTVSAFTQLLAQRTGSDQENQQYARFILDSMAHMSSMLDDLLALTSLTSGNARQSVDLHKAVDQAGRDLEQAILESGAVITVGPLPCVLGNASQLTGLMQNLLSNAIKYRGPHPVRIEVTAEPMGTGWLVKVRDNGIGIAPAYHEQIFGLFKRLHQRSVPGTGIGLAICKKIVDGMGGKIWVESEPGQGSTFCFTAQSAPE
ncbi:MAG TPA: ATP-binding protein [Bryobacteraceae bacterium]|nr:ATP-binding protein [Bryobacteraceae bacterium]